MERMALETPPREVPDFYSNAVCKEKESLSLWLSLVLQVAQSRDPFHLLCTSPLIHVE